jgi:hypothetical protein
VHEILYRELYRGVIVWNKTQKRNQWGQHQQRARPVSEHLRVEAPALRIVAEPDWTAAHERLDEPGPVSPEHERAVVGSSAERYRCEVSAQRPRGMRTLRRHA